MKVVKVYGALRKRLGQCRFEFDVTTPAQAIKALCVNFPGLEKWLIDSEKDGIAYRVTVGKERATDDNVALLLMPFSEKEVFSIAPVVAGAGRGGLMIGLGIALVATAIVTGGTSLAFTAGGFGVASGVTATAGLSLAAAAGNIGVALLLGGVATALSPQPSLDSTLDEAVQLESFSISNVVNTSRQGLPVPIAYGRVFVGSAVISSNLDVSQRSA